MSVRETGDDTAEAPAPGRASDLTRRLEAARSERAQLALARAKAESERALSAQLEAEERALANERAIAAAESEHGELGKYIATVETRSGVVIVKRPSAVLYRRFQDTGKTTTADLEKLVLPSVVYPDLTVFGRWCDDEPAITQRCADAVVTLAGWRREEVSGK